MARFDVYRNPDGRGYLLDVQADILSYLETCLVIPLLPPNHAPKPARGLNPVFHIGEEPVVLMTQYAAAVPRSVLKTGAGNLAQHYIEIVQAIDMLLQGF